MSEPVRVREIMAGDPLTCSPSDRLDDAVEKMNRLRVGSIIAVEGGRPVGIVTERDILVKVVAKGRLARDLRVHEIMSAPVRTILEDAPVEEAAKRMVDWGIKRLVVLSGSSLVGIITATDIMRAVAAGKLAREVYLYLSDIFKGPHLSGLIGQKGC
ncbi:MAG: CBS domain-containing protein [Candidatus Bathyarchaeia archaeon]